MTTKTPVCRSALSSSIVALVVAASASSGGVHAQTVSGVAVDESGARVPSALVTLRGPGGSVEASARADERGAFVLTVPVRGQYRIHADAPGHLPFVSTLFDLGVDRPYEIELEMRTAPAGSIGGDIPEERYLEWLRRFAPDSRQRDKKLISGRAWRELAAGRDLYEALEMADFPRVRFRRTPGGFCATSGSSTGCMGIGVLAHGATPRLIDLHPDEVEAVLYVGPGVRSAPTRNSMGWTESQVNAQILLFLSGYLDRGG